MIQDELPQKSLFQTEMKDLYHQKVSRIVNHLNEELNRCLHDLDMDGQFDDLYDLANALSFGNVPKTEQEFFSPINMKESIKQYYNNLYEKEDGQPTDIQEHEDFERADEYYTN
jgi:hypothetical protein